MHPFVSIDFTGAKYIIIGYSTYHIYNKDTPDQMDHYKKVDKMPITKQKTCILILGMHRSGTSCLTGVLQQSGVELGDVYTQNPHNKKGNRENARVMALNEAVLKENMCTWDKPALISKWSVSQAQERELIINEIKQNANKFFGFKDPRVVVTLPFWIETLNPVYIATYRHPLRVAYSLYARSGMQINDGIELWYNYNSRIYKIILETKSPLVNFDLTPPAYLIDVSNKIKMLGLNSLLADKAIKFFSPDLRNQTHKDITSEQLPDKVIKLYKKFQDYHAQN